MDNKYLRVGAVAAVVLALVLSVYAVIQSSTDIQTMGTTHFTGNLDVGGSLTVGTDDLYPLGYVSDGRQAVCASTTVTGDDNTVSVSALTAVEYVVATLATDPGSGAGDPFIVTVDEPSGSAAEFVLNVWQDDASAATSGATVEYCAVGTQ